MKKAYRTASQRTAPARPQMPSVARLRCNAIANGQSAAMQMEAI